MTTSPSDQAFFGRRKGHKLRPHQAGLMDELLSQLAVDPAAPLTEPLETLFPNPVREIWLEIGFGGSEHMIHQARNNPDVGIIGIEPFVNGMAKALASIEQHDLKNIRLYHDDALHVLNWLPDECLDRIFLLYPDPWPKKRHWKRRFVSQTTIGHFGRLLKPGRHFRFASDIDTYVDWTLRHIHNEGSLVWTANKAQDWKTPWSDWPGTRYEAKAFRENRVPAYLTFAKG